MNNGTLIMNGKGSGDFVGKYIVTMRPYLMCISGITGLAGISFSHGASLPVLGAVLLASWLSYGFGQALTDCFQTDTDSVSASYRPLTRGELSKGAVLIISLAGLIACSLLFSLTTLANIALGLLAVLGLATYTWFKRRWWAGPAYNAAIVVILFAMAMVGAGKPASFLSARIIAAALAVFFGYAHFVLVGYFKDVEADRKTGYETFPVKFGKEPAIMVSDILAVSATVCAGISCAIALPAAGHWYAIVFVVLAFVLGSCAFLVSQRSIRLFPADDKAYVAIIPGLYAYILLLASISIVNQFWTIFPACGTLLVFEKTLQRRPERSQI